MKILYVTTFNEKLYNLSGSSLVDSFLNNNVLGDFLVCYENMDFHSNNEKIIPYNISTNAFLGKWLDKHKNIIPKFYNGTAEDNSEIFNDPTLSSGDTGRGQYWARFRASRYFRKVAALHYAINTYSNDYDYIFVIDSDCLFLENLNKDLIDSLFCNNVGMIYFWGKYRKSINRGPESGFIGYCKKNNGYEFGKLICNYFESDKFLDYDFWDDGYIIGKVINEHQSKFKLFDLVKDSNKRTTRVMDIPENKLFKYVKHFKNRHQTSL